MDLVAVALQLELANVTLASQTATMRASDHQFRQPLVLGIMQRQGESGVPFDVEGSGYGFRVVKTISALDAQQASTCKMQRLLHQSISQPIYHASTHPKSRSVKNP